MQDLAWSTVPSSTKISIVRATLIAWVSVWATSRVDVPLHLVSWILLGGLAAGLTRDVWTTTPLLYWGVELAQDSSSALLDVLPASELAWSFFSLIFGLLALSALRRNSAAAPKPAGASGPLELAAKPSSARQRLLGVKFENKRGAWIFFVLVRILLPSSLAMQFGPEAAVSSSVVYVALTLASLLGPLASWPATCFALADACYSLLTMDALPASPSSGTEAAVVAACLCLGHDGASRYALHFFEAFAFAVAFHFIVMFTIVVVSQRGLDEAIESGDYSLAPSLNVALSWSQALNAWATPDFWTYAVTRAPPALVTAWATGMHLRTFTQGRVKPLEIVACTIGALVFGGLVLLGSSHARLLVTRPMFAAVVAVSAMSLSTLRAAGRPRLLQANRYYVATGVFPPVPAFDVAPAPEAESEGVSSSHATTPGSKSEPSSGASSRRNSSLSRPEIFPAADPLPEAGAPPAATNLFATPSKPPPSASIEEELQIASGRASEYKKRAFRMDAVVHALAHDPESPDYKAAKSTLEDVRAKAELASQKEKELMEKLQHR